MYIYEPSKMAISIRKNIELITKLKRIKMGCINSNQGTQPSTGLSLDNLNREISHFRILDYKNIKNHSLNSVFQIEQRFKTKKGIMNSQPAGELILDSSNNLDKKSNQQEIVALQSVILTLHDQKKHFSILEQNSIKTFKKYRKNRRKSLQFQQKSFFGFGSFIHFSALCKMCFISLPRYSYNKPKWNQCPYCRGYGAVLIQFPQLTNPRCNKGKCLKKGRFQVHIPTFCKCCLGRGYLKK